MVELTDKSEVNEENYVPIPEDKLKEEQRKEYEELVEKFKCECLKSYNVTRSVIKKFNLPSFQPLTEAQCENKMMDAVGQAVAQVFIKSSIVMAIRCTTLCLRLLLKARFQDAWVLATYSQIRYSMSPWK